MILSTFQEPILYFTRVPEKVRTLTVREKRKERTVWMGIFVMN